MLHLQWSTLVFQLLNFFILLAVLGHFLYRPLMDAMRRREEAVAARVREADERAARADAERAQLAEAARAARAEADALGARARAEASKLKEEEHARARQEAARLIEEARRQIADEERAARQRVAIAARSSAVTIAGRLIRAVAGRPFHEALVAQVLDHGLRLDGAQADLLRRALGHAGQDVVVQTAYPMDSARIARLEEVLAKTVAPGGARLHTTVDVEPSLGAGLRIVVGVGVVDLSLERILAGLEREAAAEER